MATRNHQRDDLGRMDRFADRRKRYASVLKIVGLAESFAALHPIAQHMFYKLKLPEPVLEYDASFPPLDVSRPVRRAVEARFRAACFDVGGQKLSVRDYNAVAGGLAIACRDIPRLKQFPAELIRFLDESLPVLLKFMEDHQRASGEATFKSIIEPLAAHSRMDTRLYFARPVHELNERGKFAFRVVLCAAEAQGRQVTLEGNGRAAWRVGDMRGQAIEWVSWNGKAFGRDPGREYPVYVQSHALRQLSERVNLPKIAPYLQAWLTNSLHEPKIAQRQGNDLFVAFEILGHRLGYLIVTPMNDLVVVRTFLFLTMEPAPESRLLKKQMHLTRQEVDWLGLSDLAAFTQTDLKNDAVLRHLFAKCGCGHLFELDDLTAADCAPQPKPFAAEVRKFLGIAA